MLYKLLLQIEKYPIDFLSHLSSSLPIIIGLISYKYLLKSHKLIILFFLFYFLKDSFALWLSLLKQNNLFIQNIEVIIETWILALILYYAFQSITIRIIGILVALGCGIIMIGTYQQNEVSSVGLTLFRIYSIFFCLSYFNKILKETRVKNILHHTLFWFTAGLLMYSAGTFFMALFSDYWYGDAKQVPDEVFDKYWNATQLLFTLFAVSSAYGLWVSKHDRTNLI
ncbi:hypothetical protein [Spirosoma montaniterrae]|uniref:Uncharacterized protein n=1 Tax=Spirosoma montaniterrae TaxID=1178516 RepID=A0A1P9X2G1_9BACT|nr:hypothetical protein [Spirosoma montaniterrae]AQG81809.1 hypothetical protein AWR27_22385 [Spirosoma montaniterrae]